MPLIRRTQRQRSSTAPPSEEESIEALTRKTIFTILKSFIGSGVLFLPKGFENGGMLFSIVVLFLVAILSTFCMLRLTACSAQLQRRGEFGGAVSYGLVGEIAYGKIGRVAVNVSLVLSQLGFCCSYLIFIERNIRDVIMHCTNCRLIPGPWLMIILQIPIYTPLTWVRKIKYFAITNLFADALILFGLLWIMSYSLEHMETSDVPADWQNFNSDHFGLFLGTAVYVFEGIGLVLPIYNAVDARLKDRFPVLLSNTIIGLVIFLCVFAGIVYASFGIDTQAVVTLNLPNVGINGGTIAVQVAYSIALVLTYPLMMYPALMILEGYCIPTKRGAVKGLNRWRKNVFRFLVVCLTATISIFCLDKLDNFVALIGGFCSVPLAFIYPCLFHSRLMNTGVVYNNITVAIGLCIMVLATYQAISSWGPAQVEADYCTSNSQSF